MRRRCLSRDCENTTAASYCTEHAPRKHDGLSSTQRGMGYDHQQMAKRVLAEEKVCWICGRGATLEDPLTADHIVPRSRGGANVRANYHAAHASCNSRRGNKTVAGMTVQTEGSVVSRYAV